MRKSKPCPSVWQYSGKRSFLRLCAPALPYPKRHVAEHTGDVTSHAFEAHDAPEVCRPHVWADSWLMLQLSLGSTEERRRTGLNIFKCFGGRPAGQIHNR